MTSPVGTVIVGAGFAGIAAAIALKRAGATDFVILERAESVGGTWRDNRYPGVACDVPAHLYALESHPWPEWSRTFAPGDEIRAYLERVVDAEGLRAHIRFGHALEDARWDGDRWEVRTGVRTSGLGDGRSVRTDPREHAPSDGRDIRADARDHPPGATGAGGGTRKRSAGEASGASAPNQAPDAAPDGASDDARGLRPAGLGGARMLRPAGPGDVLAGAANGTAHPAPGRGGTIRAEHLVLACGRLSEPRIPHVPGLAGFHGPVFHSARWPDGLSVAGKRVAVVGTGASAVQLAPALADRGADVTVFQRTPAWIMPRGDRAHTDAERTEWRETAGALAEVRAELYADGEARFASRSGDAAAAGAASRAALAHLHAAVEDPHLRAALTPDYAFGCKRVLLSDEFYAAIGSGAVRLEPSALAAVDDGSLVAASGARHDADIVVLATGFRATRQSYAPLVTGEHGTTLDEHWSGGFTAVASTLVHGFPNLFVLGGPNATLGHNSAVLLLEAQAALAADLIADRAGAPVRVSAEAEREATAEVDEMAAGTPWLTGGCRNWYVDERSGRLTLIWPSTVAAFRERLDRVRSALLAPTASGGAR
ncbi:flavin-containing monooxygenase [Microbacterium halophytorum]|uniref:flavin-containing monooxygenase n=1 Tax=Microbacterium halophytorum TaxID=2067568 RepID=UPI001E477C07|nr:NAD(P)/FAD-dependent oxidoreductase [Microbacterium halophytorum]